MWVQRESLCGWLWGVLRRGPFTFFSSPKKPVTATHLDDFAVEQYEVDDIFPHSYSPYSITMNVGFSFIHQLSDETLSAFSAMKEKLSEAREAMQGSGDAVAVGEALVEEMEKLAADLAYKALWKMEWCSAELSLILWSC